MIEPFKCAHAMFLSLRGGSRQFDLRRWDITDERIYQLAWHTMDATIQARVPAVDTVSFADQETGELITLEYKGVTFTPWAPGWVFILVGKRIEP